MSQQFLFRRRQSDVIAKPSIRTSFPPVLTPVGDVIAWELTSTTEETSAQRKEETRTCGTAIVHTNLLVVPIQSCCVFCFVRLTAASDLMKERSLTSIQGNLATNDFG
jgi:hypothetical protein